MMISLIWLLAFNKWKSLLFFTRSVKNTWRAARGTVPATFVGIAPRFQLELGGSHDTANSRKESFDGPDQSRYLDRFVLRRCIIFGKTDFCRRRVAVTGALRAVAIGNEVPPLVAEAVEHTGLRPLSSVVRCKQRLHRAERSLG